MNFKEQNKKLENKIDVKINNLAYIISEEFESYNINNTIVINGCSYSVGATYTPIKKELEKIHNIEDLRLFKYSLSNIFMELEKEEYKLNKVLDNRLTLLNGLDPSEWSYDIESGEFLEKLTELDFSEEYLKKDISEKIREEAYKKVGKLF